MNTQLKVEWMTQPATSAALLELCKCGCATVCASQGAPTGKAFFIGLMCASARTAKPFWVCQWKLVRVFPIICLRLWSFWFWVRVAAKQIHPCEFCMSTLCSVHKLHVCIHTNFCCLTPWKGWFLFFCKCTIMYNLLRCETWKCSEGDGHLLFCTHTTSASDGYFYRDTF